jgi:chemotaxis protein CheX
MSLTLAEIGAFIRQSTDEVFSTMLDLAIRPAEQAFVQSDRGARVTALLGLAGEWTGSGQVSCDPALACEIAGKFLLAEYPEVNDEVMDAIAELANMIVGNVKNSLELTLGPMGLSTPVIISGNFETRVVGNPVSVAVPFECAGGNMTVQLVLSQGGASARRQRIGSQNLN